MDIIPLELELQLQEVIKSAGLQMLARWPGNPVNKEALKITLKADGSIVTDVDLISNTLITTALNRLFPNDQILSEEGPLNWDINPQRRIWILDPLDGTQTFVDGNDDFSILLCLAIEGEVSYGVLHLPARGKFAWASKGRGTYLDGLKINVSTNPKIGRHRLYLRHLEWLNSELVYPSWLDSGQACLKLCSGELDAMVVRIKSHQEWDLATAVALIAESGGLVTDENGRPVKFGCGQFSCKYLVASNSKVHAEALAAVGASKNT